MTKFEKLVTSEEMMVELIKDSPLYDLVINWYCERACPRKNECQTKETKCWIDKDIHSDAIIRNWCQAEA